MAKPKETGTTIDDALTFVRQSMHEHVNSNKSDMSGDEEDGNGTGSGENDDSGSSKLDSSVGEIEVSDSCIFPSHVAFVAWRLLPIPMIDYFFLQRKMHQRMWLWVGRRNKRLIWN